MKQKNFAKFMRKSFALYAQGKNSLQQKTK